MIADAGPSMAGSKTATQTQPLPLPLESPAGRTGECLGRREEVTAAVSVSGGVAERGPVTASTGHIVNIAAAAVDTVVVVVVVVAVVCIPRSSC